MSLPSNVCDFENQPPPPGRGVLTLQAYHVLSCPEHHLMAATDKVTMQMIVRIGAGKHDCYICRRLLVLDPKLGDAAPGLLGYIHGDLPPEVSAVAVAACCGCVRHLGDQETARTIVQMFADEQFGGGTVFETAGGTA